jgi:hypothetical protein
MHWRGQLTTAEITQQLNAMKSFFGSINLYIPAGVTISYSGLGQEYDDAGVLKAELSVTPPAATAGTGSGNWASSSGGVIQWNTGIFNDRGHRIRGRTYLVPSSGSLFGSTGQIAPSAVTAITTAGNTLTSGLIPMVVVSKDEFGHYLTITSVTACQVSNKAAVLTSRRD